MQEHREEDVEYEQPQAATILNAKIDEEVESLHDGILSKLRDFIVEGHLRPGDRVPERQLCESLGVSRTPLREALKVLAAEGLIELLPNRGARIREFTPDDVREFFEMLAGMESTAGRLACERITEAAIEQIEALHYQMYGHYMRRELPEYFRLNQLIHERIVAAAGNHALETYYHGLTARMRRLRYSANTIKRDRWGQAMREHEQILDALRRRDGRELAEILYEHLIHKWSATSEALGTAEAE
ncbi:GntR family transcriptional regulator [Ensifer sp. LC13]|uniref:GntR family transcriptional regulator n=1 Tax=Ensifer sp. LC499 TaxID=1120654 RepID=UPI0008130953|nr:GntR family transcriptional regulator [Ensifer sp. LC499]OCO98868.1 GntR family transcriptional regulator [Ensifer sp. LC14]OCP02634.1 GntR family transcriptional regulator [Ensifer sp. LC11]OCP02968.1 GntR family transcriptional regulator [Ensifer sp. LC13]OCP29899.1 GntR family transcriptional regulator [Ensifer sp. LC499]